MNKIKSYINHSWRVLLITKKPDRTEYKTIVKASALGIGIIGLLGFILQITNQIILG